MIYLTLFSMTIRGVYKLENAFFMIFQKTHFYAILRNFFANKCPKIFCVAEF